MVRKGVILLRVQDLEQGAGRVSPKVFPELVDLVEHEHGIVRAGLFDAMNNPAGKRAHIGATVPSNLRLVPHSAKGYASEFSAHGFRDGPAKTGFSGTGRAVKAQDGAFVSGIELPDRQILENPLFHLFKIVVVSVQHSLGLSEVDGIPGGLTPGEVKQEIDIIHGHGVFRRGRVHLAHLRDLFCSDLISGLGQLLLLQPFPELLYLLRPLFVDAKFPLNSFQLFPQQVLFLAFVDSFLNLALNLLPHPGDFQLLVHDQDQSLDSLLHIQRFQDLLFTLPADIYISRDHVRQCRSAFHMTAKTKNLIR
jgi:hypothetical protein